MERKRTGIQGIIEIKNGFLVMIYRSEEVLRFRVVAIVNPAAVTAATINRELGKELSMPNEGKMMDDLSKNKAPFKTFSKIIVQPSPGRIIGVIDDRSREEITFRVIGFFDPKGLEKKYKELLSIEEREEEVPYWEHFSLGQEWKGTRMVKDDIGFTLFNGSHPVTKPLLFRAVF
jgi:hypothetical protein